MLIGDLILNKLISKKEVISASIVGSYTEKKNIDKIGDIDVVVICRKISKNIIKKIIRIVEKINLKKYKKKIIVNSSFGPLKISSGETIPIHLMVYDIKSHIQHVTLSPFTCYDWERTTFFRGMHLKDIFPVGMLQLNDFFSARRSSNEYLKDLEKNRLSIRKYIFINKKAKVIKRYLKIDERNRGEFVYHIIKFLIINLYKYINNKNNLPKEENFNKLFLQITNNNQKFLKDFKILKKNKEEKLLAYNPNIIAFGKYFIKKYNRYLKLLKNNNTIFSFVRHAKPAKNSSNRFLGVRTNPDIIKKKIRKKYNKKFDIIYTSELKRTISTAKLFNGKKIYSNQLINEIDYGVLDGKKINYLDKYFPDLNQSLKKNINIRFPKGESTSDVELRVKKFLLLLKKIKSKKNILIISHSFFLRVLIGILLKFDLRKIFKLKIKHLEMFEFIKFKNIFIPNFNRNKIKIFYKQLND